MINLDLIELKKIENLVLSNKSNSYKKELILNILNYDDITELFSEFFNLIKDNHDKLYYSFIFYVAFCNTVSFDDIPNLIDITLFESYDYLKGALYKYFKKQLSDKLKYCDVYPNQNYYDSVLMWNPKPIFEVNPLIKLLNWIYYFDNHLFFKLLNEDKSNYFFLSFFKNQLVRDFEIKEEYIICFLSHEDFLKVCSLFHYLLKPCILIANGKNSDELNKNYYDNLELLKKIDKTVLIKLIFLFIISRNINFYPEDFLEIIIENSDLSCKILDNLKISNFIELTKINIIITKSNDSIRASFFIIILNKLNELLIKNNIPIPIDQWKYFLKEFSFSEINQIKDLLVNLDNDLLYKYEFDRYIRPLRFKFDFDKHDKFIEFIEVCNSRLESI